MVFPKIAIIGRPNVGKSALFNRLLKKRIAIVNEMEGVTRDRLYGEGEFEGNPYILIDTAGIEVTDHSDLNLKLIEQTKQALKEADYCIFVVDAQVGIVKMDEEVAALIRKYKKPVCVAVNKVDLEQHADLVPPFYKLGFDHLWGISAEHGKNIYELLETVFENVSPSLEEEKSPSNKEMISIVGRPNVGKSTFINYLVNEPRCVVSPIAGTTRDAIEVEIKYEDKSYVFIDTAGVWRKNKEKEVVEKFAHIRTIGAIEKSEVCLFLINAKEGFTAQEKKLLSEIYKMGKSCLIVVNKWDLVEGFRMEHVYQALLQDCPFLSIYPVVFISALTGKNVEEVYPMLEKICLGRRQKIETPALNKFILTAMQKTPPPMVKGKRLKVYYITQIKSAPPSFLFFVNKSNLLTHTYKRYLLNRIRETFDLLGAPVDFFLKSKSLSKSKKEEALVE